MFPFCAVAWGCWTFMTTLYIIKAIGYTILNNIRTMRFSLLYFSFVLNAGVGSLPVWTVLVCACHTPLPQRARRVRVSHDSAHSLRRPFPQFSSTGFTGFTLTPLTPLKRPPTATHPVSANQRAITYWSRAACFSIGPFPLHLCFWLVTCYHPPECSEFCFCFFFLLSVVFFLRFWFTQLRLDLAVKKVVRLMYPGFVSQLSFSLLLRDVYICWILLLTPAG